MNKLIKVLEEVMNEELIQIIISNKRHVVPYKKIVIKPFLEQEELLYQFSRYTEKQVFHKNLSKENAIKDIITELEQSYKQVDIQTKTSDYSVLVNKKGVTNIKKKLCANQRTNQLEHNRKKEYLLQEGKIVPFLVELGVQTKDGKIVDKMQRKYRQINRFLEFVEDVLPSLPKNHPLTIIDFGCGKSYLTFAMYYYLKIMNHYEVNMIGLDLKTEVIEHCNRLAEKFGYHELTFLEGDISTYEGVTQVDMVVTLHACDTATDYALYKAIKWNAKVILSVPCCQHEFNQLIKSEAWKPILKYGLVKERMAALLTDAVRANLLEMNGYQVQILEFIDMEHTPKNILIKAVYDNKQKSDTKSLEELCDSMNLHGTLEKMLKNS